MWVLIVQLAVADAPSLPSFESVPVSAGAFRMGCARGSGQCWRYEKPRHSVTLTRSIEVMTTEVSQRLYAAVTGQKPWLDDEACTMWGGDSSDALPAVCIAGLMRLLCQCAEIQLGLSRAMPYRRTQKLNGTTQCARAGDFRAKPSGNMRQKLGRSIPILVPKIPLLSHGPRRTVTTIFSQWRRKYPTVWGSMT